MTGCCQHFKTNPQYHNGIKSTNSSTKAQRRRAQRADELRSCHDKWLHFKIKFNVSNRQGLAFTTCLINTPHFNGYYRKDHIKDSHKFVYQKQYSLDSIPTETSFTKKTQSKQRLRRQRIQAHLNSKITTPSSRPDKLQKQRRYTYKRNKFLCPENPTFSLPSRHIRLDKYMNDHDLKDYIPTNKSCALRWKHKTSLIQGITPDVFKQGYKDIPLQTPAPVTPIENNMIIDSIIQEPLFTRESLNIDEKTYNELKDFFPTEPVSVKYKIVPPGSHHWLKRARRLKAIHFEKLAADIERKRLADLAKIQHSYQGTTCPIYYSVRNSLMIELTEYSNYIHKTYHDILQVTDANTGSNHHTDQVADLIKYMLDYNDTYLTQDYKDKHYRPLKRPIGDN